MENKVNVFMPKSYDLVVGDTFQLFYTGIIESPNPYGYAIVATCDKGKNFPRYFEFTTKFGNFQPRNSCLNSCLCEVYLKWLLKVFLLLF